jgi:hypothetical protein
MADLPPDPARSQSYPELPVIPSQAYIVRRFGKLVLAMAVVMVILAVLPVPRAVAPIALMGVPAVIMILAMTEVESRKSAFVGRHMGAVFEHLHDREYLTELGERAREPTRTAPLRGLLLVGLFVLVIVIGLVMSAFANGVRAGIYGG